MIAPDDHALVPGAPGGESGAGGENRDSCDRATLLIAAALDGVIDANEERELSAHLETCALCRETFLALTVDEVAGDDGAEHPADRLGNSIDRLESALESAAEADGRAARQLDRPPDGTSPDGTSEDRMFESYVGNRSRKRPRWVGMLVAASLGLHAVLVIALIVQGFWVIEKLTAPNRDLAIAVAPPPPPPPPPPPASKKKIEPNTVKKVRVTEPTQPVEQPPEDPDAPLEIVDESEGVEGGVVGGVAGGVVGGVVGGVMEGLPGGKIEAPPPPPPPAKPKTVPQQAVKALRLSGDDRITPDETTKTQIMRDGMSQIVATVKMCLSTSGQVTSLQMLKGSGYDDYDRKIQSKMRAWRYKPFLVNGQAVPVCTAVTFIYRQTN